MTDSSHQNTDRDHVLALYREIMHDETLKPTERIAAAKEYTRLKGFDDATPTEQGLSVTIHLPEK